MLQRHPPSLLASSIRRIAPVRFFSSSFSIPHRSTTRNPTRHPGQTSWVTEHPRADGAWGWPACLHPAPARSGACLKAAHCYRGCYMSLLHPKVLRLKRRIPFKTCLCLWQLSPPCTEPYDKPSHQGECGTRGHPSRARAVRATKEQIRMHSNIWNNTGLFLNRGTRQSAFNPQIITLLGVSQAEKICSHSTNYLINNGQSYPQIL